MSPATGRARPPGAQPDGGRRRVVAGLGALALGLRLAPARAAGGTELRFLDCRGRPGETAFAAFTEDTGRAVALDACIDAPSLYGRIRDGNAAAWDLIVLPDRYIARMIFGNLLHALEPPLLPNLRHLDAAFANAAFDPGRRYSVAYLWGTLGIGYRRSAVEGVPDTWKSIFDSERHAGRIGWLDDPQLTLQVALRYLGHSVNTLDPAQIEAAAALLRHQRPRVAQLAREAGGASPLPPGIDVALANSGDAARAARGDPDIHYVVPREGTLLWQDCLCIPRGAAHPREAHGLIDFLLRPEIGAGIASASLCATPNAAARDLLPESYRADPTIHPPADVLARSEIAAYRGERAIQLYERAWASVGARS